MKNLFLILTCFLLIHTLANGQYRINKTKYDYRSYDYRKSDPCSPAVAGFASLLLPGTGQMISGEFGRGAAFFGGYAACITIFISGSLVHDINTAVALDLIGFMGVVAVDLISVVDAVRVAKLNNLVFRDKSIPVFFVFFINIFFSG